MVRTLWACYHLGYRNWFLNNSSFSKIFYSLLQKIHKHAALNHKCDPSPLKLIDFQLTIDQAPSIQSSVFKTLYDCRLFKNYFDKQISIWKEDIWRILIVQKTRLICLNDFCNHEKQSEDTEGKQCLLTFFNWYFAMYYHSIAVMFFTLLWYQATPQILLGKKTPKTYIDLSSCELSKQLMLNSDTNI